MSAVPQETPKEGNKLQSLMVSRSKDLRMWINAVVLGSIDELYFRLCNGKNQIMGTQKNKDGTKHKMNRF